jgi:hypothetical protein
MVICSKSTDCVIVHTVQAFSYLVYLLKTLRVCAVFAAATQTRCVKALQQRFDPSQHLSKQAPENLRLCV